MSVSNNIDNHVCINGYPNSKYTVEQVANNESVKTESQYQVCKKSSQTLFPLDIFIKPVSSLPSWLKRCYSVSTSYDCVNYQTWANTENASDDSRFYCEKKNPETSPKARVKEEAICFLNCMGKIRGQITGPMFNYSCLIGVNEYVPSLLSKLWKPLFKQDNMHWDTALNKLKTVAKRVAECAIGILKICLTIPVALACWPLLVYADTISNSDKDKAYAAARQKIIGLNNTFKTEHNVSRYYHHSGICDYRVT